jgi:hypothetical protein
LSQSDFDLGFWSDRGWKVPKEFELAEDDHPFIDYTFQYLVSIPIHSPVRDKDKTRPIGKENNDILV